MKSLLYIGDVYPIKGEEETLQIFESEFPDQKKLFEKNKKKLSSTFYRELANLCMDSSKKELYKEYLEFNYVYPEEGFVPEGILPTTVSIASINMPEDLNNLPKQMVRPISRKNVLTISNTDAKADLFLEGTIKNLSIPKYALSLAIVKVENSSDLADFLECKHVAIGGKAIIFAPKDALEGQIEQLVTEYHCVNIFDFGDTYVYIGKKIHLYYRYKEEELKKEIEGIKTKLSKAGAFKILANTTFASMPEIDIEDVEDCIGCMNDPTICQSKPDDTAWQKYKEALNGPMDTDENLVLPKELKQGELALLVASGKGNGNISLPDGTGKHISIGGVENINSEIVEVVETNKWSGEAYVVTKTSKPFIKLLIQNEQGQLYIKKLT